MNDTDQSPVSPLPHPCHTTKVDVKRACYTLLKALNCGKYMKLKTQKSADDIVASGQVLQALNVLSSAEENCQKLSTKEGPALVLVCFCASGQPTNSHVLLYCRVPRIRWSIFAGRC